MKIDLDLQQPVYFRENTSDEYLIHEFLIDKKGYQFPRANPKVIFDIGANIGVASIVMANIYKDAEIYAFEPVSDNFELLLKNTETYKRVHALPFGLGSKSFKTTMFRSDDEINHGGCSLFEKGSDTSKTIPVDIINVNEAIASIGARPDLIKIDAEGAEHDILTSLSNENISGVSFLLGEVHAQKTFELLDYLDKYFDLSFHKQFGNGLFPFYGISRRFVQ